jgi:hypothetical protein
MGYRGKLLGRRVLVFCLVSIRCLEEYEDGAFWETPGSSKEGEGKNVCSGERGEMVDEVGTWEGGWEHWEDDSSTGRGTEIGIEVSVSWSECVI